jgi:hypothetical protein
MRVCGYSSSVYRGDSCTVVLVSSYKLCPCSASFACSSSSIALVINPPAIGLHLFLWRAVCAPERLSKY